MRLANNKLFLNSQWHITKFSKPEVRKEVIGVVLPFKDVVCCYFNEDEEWHFSRVGGPLPKEPTIWTEIPTLENLTK